MPVRAETRAVTRAIPRFFERIKSHNAAQMRADGGTFKQFAGFVPIRGDFLRAATDYRARSVLNLEKLSPSKLEIVLREVARALAVGNTPKKNETVKSRAQRALTALESLGGASSLENADGKFSVESVTNCPFDVSVSAHPEVCRLAEAFLSEVTGLKVQEHCQKGLLPKCSFEITNERES